MNLFLTEPHPAVTHLKKVKSLMCKFSISLGESYFATIHWIPAFAGMTGTYSQSSFPRRRESSNCYPDLLRTYFNVIELCELLVELAQLHSEMLEKSIQKNVKEIFHFKEEYITQVCHSKINGNFFWDKEDAYRLDYLRRKHPLPTNIQHIMSEGHVEDFFGSWCAEEETDDDIFDPDDNWQIIFDVP